MIKTIIVDDDSHVRATLKLYLSKYQDFLLLAECKTGIQAKMKITKLEPELIFLDLQLPDMSGFDVLDSIELKPKTVFMSDNDKYALRAFERNAIDYLLKPLSHERFKKCNEKVNSFFPKRESKQSSSLSTKIKYKNKSLIVKKDRQYVMVDLEKILYIKAFNDYILIISQMGNFTKYVSMKQIEEELKNTIFIRVHRSFLINALYIKSYDQSLIKMSDDSTIPVSQSGYKNIITFLE